MHESVFVPNGVLIADFIALATHGRSGMRRLLMGSIAEGVMRHATTPVLCFPLRGYATD